MRHVLKFLHTMGAIGLIGSMAAFLVLLSFLPDPGATAEYARMRAAMRAIADWIFLPSLVLTLVAGLIAIGNSRAYQDAGWAWVKLASGLVVFEGSLTAIHGPMRREAELSAQALTDGAALVQLGASSGSEWLALWIMLAIAIANVGLGVWRPRFRRRKAS